MRVLVTGHEGYIGSVLVRALQGRGHSAVGLDVGYYRADVRWPAARPDAALSADVRDVASAALEGADAIVHLAALSNDPMADLDPSLTAEINHAATVRLAQLALGAGIRRFVFASSCSVYGSAGTGIVTEESPTAPLTAYAQSKLASERDLQALAAANPEFCPVLLRNATAYGFSPALRTDLVVNNLVAGALTTGEVRLLSDGSAWRPLVHVEDIAAAMIASLEASPEAVRGAIFNIGRSTENYRVRDVAEIVAAAVPGCRVTIAPGASADARSYNVSFAKAETLPGFAPRWTVPDGVADLVEKLSGAGLTAEVAQGPQFVRLKRLRASLEAGILTPRLRFAA